MSEKSMIPDSEFKLLELIWDGEPIRSGELVSRAFEALNWKKSTVYTILKKLVDKGLVKNESSVITSECAREDVLSEKSEDVISRNYGGSLPMFLTAFLSREKLTKKEAEELKKLIDSYTEEV